MARSKVFKASSRIAPEVAQRARERDGGWEVYDRRLREWASRSSSHPDYRADWGPTEREG
jgi:hypothetical protein